MEEISEKYTLDGQIGRGCFSVIWGGHTFGHKNDRVAIKVFNLDPEATGYGAVAAAAEVQFLERIKNFTEEESSLLQKLREYYLPAHGESNKPAYIVCDFCDGTDLTQLINELGEKNETLERRLVVRFIHQLITAMSTLVRHKIVHRDIKPDNIIILSGHQKQLKLIDFGLATDLPQGEATVAVEPCITCHRRR